MNESRGVGRMVRRFKRIVQRRQPAPPQSAEQPKPVEETHPDPVFQFLIDPDTLLRRPR
jgi:hypothetical protein